MNILIGSRRYSGIHMKFRRTISEAMYWMNEDFYEEYDKISGFVSIVFFIGKRFATLVLRLFDIGRIEITAQYSYELEKIEQTEKNGILKNSAPKHKKYYSLECLVQMIIKFNAGIRKIRTVSIPLPKNSYPFCEKLKIVTNIKNGRRVICCEKNEYLESLEFVRIDALNNKWVLILPRRNIK